jgi:hypothetical protein
MHICVGWYSIYLAVVGDKVFSFCRPQIQYGHHHKTLFNKGLYGNVSNIYNPADKAPNDIVFVCKSYCI